MLATVEMVRMLSHQKVAQATQACITIIARVTNTVFDVMYIDV